MGSVYERKHPSGRIVYRMKMGNKKTRYFTLTFDEWDEAVQFLDENEKHFMEDPEYFFDWREKEFRKMRKNRIGVQKGLVRGPVPPV